MAKMAPGRQISSRFSNSAVLMSSSSAIASTTRSTSARSSKAVVPVMHPTAASMASWSILPRCRAFSRLRRIDAVTFATLSSDRATKVTENPALANTSMIPVAMVPEPTTPTVVTSRTDTSIASCVATWSSATISGEPGSA